MKKIKIISIFMIICILVLNMMTITEFAVESYKATTYIDSPASGQQPVVEDILTISGWYMSDDEQAQIKVYIDEQEQQILQTIREERKDVINAVQGYGGIETNPTPGFVVKIDLAMITHGLHNLKIDIVSRNGDILATNNRIINVQNYKAKTYIETPQENAQILGEDAITIDGWVMTDDIDAQLKVFVDGQEQEIQDTKRFVREDVLNSIKGYGSIEENSTPGYSLKINTNNIRDGKHTLTLKVISRAGDILTTSNKTIIVKKYSGTTYIEHPQAWETIKPVITIGGWAMTTDLNDEINIYIDNQKQEVENVQRTKRGDVINSIKGYGGIEKNPLPGFEATLNLSNIKEGVHILKVEIVSEKGDIITSDSRYINVEKYKAKTYIESLTSNSENIFKIDGWVMSDDIESQIKIFIDGKEHEIKEIQRTERTDVTDGIKGYGSNIENPQPGYSISVDVSNIKDGEHELVVKILSRTGEILTTNTRTIIVKKYIAKMNIETPEVWGIIKPVANISGWIMTNDEKSTVNIYLDGKKQNVQNFVRVERTDVIDGVKGYGGIEKNPLPGFEATLDLLKVSEGIHELRVEVVSREGNVITSINRYINLENYKAKTHIENPSVKEIKRVESILTIDGWVMSDDVQADLKIYVDGIEREIKEIQRHERTDVINVTSGYGGIEENPNPGYSIQIDLSDLKDGQHTIRLDVISRTGEVVATNTRTIELDKYKVSATIELPNVMGQSKKELLVGGWLMSTDEKASVRIYINNEKQNIIELTRNERNDVIDAIKGYGGIEKNPLPGFEAKVDVSKFEDGKYTLRVEFVSREDEIMYSESRVIVIYNNYDLGIDVSKWNGTVDWKKVKEHGVSFAMVRAGYRGYGTEGTLVIDNTFVRNMKGAIENGIEVGVYFFSQAITEAEAIEEAEMTIRLIEENGFANELTFPVVIDTESAGGRADGMSKEQRTLVVKAFCQRIAQAGYTPMIYANKDWLYNNLIMSQLSEYDVWLAHYTGTDDPVNNPSDYKGSHQIWQYTSTGIVPGINGNVDMNISYKKYFK